MECLSLLYLLCTQINAGIRNCDHFADPDNGDVIYESLHENDSEMSAAVGTIATFSCKHGYELTGEKTLTCEINQETNTTKWSGDGKAPTCRRKIIKNR